MSFPFNFYLAAVLAPAATVLVMAPLWRYWCLRNGLVDDPGERKIHACPTPLSGGLAVMTGLLAPSAAAALVFWRMHHGNGQETFAQTTLLSSLRIIEYGWSRRVLELAGILAGAGGMVFLGWWDDRHELKAGPKFAGQLLLALMVAACGVRVTLFVPNLLFSYALTALWILTMVNAFNFMDNMNGLCTGVGAIGAWCFAVMSAAAGQYLVALMAFLTFGALLGFLPYNFPQARAFLGDAGSHLVGYLLAILAILPHFYTPSEPRRSAVLIPLLVLAVPLADMALVVTTRSLKGKAFWIGDTNHLSHRLVRAGLSPTRAVLMLWLIAALMGSAGVLCRR